MAGLLMEEVVVGSLGSSLSATTELIKFMRYPQSLPISSLLDVFSVCGAASVGIKK